MPRLFDDVSWYNALAPERPKPRGFRLNSADIINRDYGPLAYEDKEAAQNVADLLAQKGQVGVVGKMLGNLGLDESGERKAQTWGNALRATAMSPVEAVEGIYDAVLEPYMASGVDGKYSTKGIYQDEFGRYVDDQGRTADPTAAMIPGALNFAGNMAIGGSVVPKVASGAARVAANTAEASAPGVVMAEAARQPKPVQMEVPFYRGSAHGQTSVDYSQPYWGTSDKGLASDYAKSRSRTYFDAEATPNVTPAVARFRNPLHIDAQNAGWSEVPFEGQKWNTDKLAETAKQRGHDGLVIDRLYDEGRWNPDEGLPSTVAALRPGTVSSAFDPNNILYQNAKNAAPAGVLLSQAGDQAPRVGDDPLIELLRRYGVTR